MNDYRLHVTPECFSLLQDWIPFPVGSSSWLATITLVRRYFQIIRASISGDWNGDIAYPLSLSFQALEDEFGRNAAIAVPKLPLFEISPDGFLPPCYDYKDQEWKKGRCRTARISGKFFTDFIRFNTASWVRDYWWNKTRRCIEAFTGETHNQRKPKGYYDRSRNEIAPGLIQKALSRLKKVRAPINLLMIDAILASLPVLFPTSDLSTVTKKLQIAAILGDFDFGKTRLGIGYYTPEYPTIAKIGGRIFEGGGLQGAPRWVRAALLLDVTCFNYDMASSHPSILYALTGYEPLKEFIAISKPEIAARLSIDVDRHKEIVSAIISSAGGIYVEPVHGREWDNRKMKQARRALDEGLVKIVYAPIIEAAQALTAKLVDFYGTTGKIENLCGIKLDMESKEVSKKRKSKLVCHTIQGIESFFVHHLTVLCFDSGITVYSNQHDGLITDKVIPEDLIANALQALFVRGKRLFEPSVCNGTVPLNFIKKRLEFDQIPQIVMNKAESLKNRRWYARNALLQTAINKLLRFMKMGISGSLVPKNFILGSRCKIAL